MILPQTVFAFQRVKYKMFQEKVQLYLNEGAEILVKSEHEMFQSLYKSNATDNNEQKDHNNNDHNGHNGNKSNDNNN